MKRIYFLLFGFISATAMAQSNSGSQTIDATKKTDKSAVEMTNADKGKTSGITPKDRSASAGGSLTVENSKKKQTQENKKEQIPDGSYQTNITGMPYSEDPNYPYDRDGKLIQNKDAEIVKGKSAKKENPSQNLEVRKDPNTKK
jgi:hypothetical protein